MKEKPPYLVIADMDVREFFSAICGAIADRARSYNLNLIWGAKQEFFELSRNGLIDDYVARCKRENIRGVFFVPQDAQGEKGVEQRNQQIAETLRQNGITVILIDRDIVPFPRRSDFDFVGIDDISISRHLGLSSLRQPARFIGEEAARLMALRLGQDTLPPRQVIFSAELTPRASSTVGK